MYDIDKIANRFWERMTELYGTSWANKFGDEPTQSWIDVLNQYEPGVIARAIKGVIKEYQDFPPSLPAFLNLLKSQQPTTQEYLDALPAPSEPMTEQQKKVVHKVLEAAKPKGKKITRSVLLPGEGYSDFQDAMAESGLPEQEFRHKRLLENGWTDEMEEKFFNHAQSLGLVARMGL